MEASMAYKVTDRYLKGDSWHIKEQGFNPSKGRFSESVFSLANEFMGVRGYFEEGYSGDRLQGSYFNNLYEELQVGHPQVFKGMVSRVCFGVNSVDWLYTRISLDGEELDLAKSNFEDFSRSLDMSTGTLTRSFTWITASGKKLALTFQRFLSMDNPHWGFQKISFVPLNFSSEIQVESGLDFSILHEIAEGWDQTQKAQSGGSRKGKNFWDLVDHGFEDLGAHAVGKSIKSKHLLFSSFKLNSNALLSSESCLDNKTVLQKLTLNLEEGKETFLEKSVSNFWEKTDDLQAFRQTCQASAPTFAQAYELQKSYWQKAWDLMDIGIEGDDDSLQGVRFSIFTLHSTYHGFSPELNIPGKGLTGEVYHGEVFWDTESYCMPFYIFTNPEAAKNLIRYRHKYLPQACERASQLDCKGASYPMCTLDGTESCATWQHGDFEIHVGVAITYAIWLCHRLGLEKDLIFHEGIEILLQVSRFYFSRGERSPLTGEFCLYGVMGPDEYHMNVNNNAYTNVMVKKTFEFTLQVLELMKLEAPELLDQVTKKVNLDPSELLDWKNAAIQMRVPQNPNTGIVEQHDGYFDLPNVDVKGIPESQIPIYQHWAYVKIFRYNMIKQPDVLLLTLFFSKDFTFEQKLANYEYYEPKCIHESSLSPSIHSILATELGKTEEAFDFFVSASRLDLDNRNKNTDQGLHVTAMSGAYLSMVYGFGGLRTDGETLSFSPSIPEAWTSFKFKLLYRSSVLQVAVDKTAAEFRVLEGCPITIEVYGKPLIAGPEGTKVSLAKPGACAVE
jgi:maltose phosphorylase